MSKLAAICAKLKGDAVSVSDKQSASDVTGEGGGPVLPLFPPPLEERIVDSDEDQSARYRYFIALCIDKCKLVCLFT